MVRHCSFLSVSFFCFTSCLFLVAYAFSSHFFFFFLSLLSHWHLSWLKLNCYFFCRCDHHFDHQLCNDCEDSLIRFFFTECSTKAFIPSFPSISIFFTSSQHNRHHASLSSPPPSTLSLPLSCVLYRSRVPVISFHFFRIMQSPTYVPFPSPPSDLPSLAFLLLRNSYSYSKHNPIPIPAESSDLPRVTNLVPILRSTEDRSTKEV